MADNSTDTAALPNPLTPMAFLPPDIAFDMTIGIYIMVGTVGALVWETLNNIRLDYHLLTRFRITLAAFVYVISRIATLIFLVGTTVVMTAPIGACRATQRVIAAFYPIAMSTTALLFWFRARALYIDKKWVVAFLFLTWLMAAGGTITPMREIAHTTLGPTKYCISPEPKAYISIALWTCFANDFIVFAAITWRLMHNHTAEATMKNNLKAMLFGHYLPSLSRALLQDGQVYILSTVGVNLLTGICFYNYSIPAVYRSIFGMPNVMIMNVMACRIYRDTKLGLMRPLNPLSSTRLSQPTLTNVTRPIAFQHGAEAIDNESQGGIWMSDVTLVDRKKGDSREHEKLRLDNENIV
ncbi:hypothetical protein NLJ89_g3103 [Agrocybe chaxingu]|uniref:Uncharacterized protein n=1 Tax=Agrocybe chaxingu TaxID=84603 RepID=A0A9W8K5I8_9AGAR|nr:hypothetical protein NLJ89_g3103 [Agrocybe chaxingu]